MFSSSIPVDMPFMSLAAFFAAVPAPDAADPALSDAAATASIPAAAAETPPPDDFFPDISSVNALNAFARVISFPMIVLITLSTGERTLINPCPIVALRLSNCNLRILTWFAHPSEVLEKSPAAEVS